MFARMRLACTRSARVRSALPRFVSWRSAPLRRALLRFVALMSAPLSFAKLRSPWLTFAFVPSPFSLTVTTPFSRKPADFPLASSSVSVTSPPTGTTWNSMNRVSPFRPSAALLAPGPNYDALGLETINAC